VPPIIISIPVGSAQILGLNFFDTFLEGLSVFESIGKI